MVMGARVRQKPLIIHGPLPDLGDIVAIARVEGKKVLGVDRVNVKPFISSYGDSDYLVVVEESVGCSKAIGVGSSVKQHP